jgi:hypothetical protein
MKKAIIFLAITICYLCWGCKKDQETGPEKTIKNNQFLKSVKVEGARTVTIDTALSYIQIILPETFKSDIIDIELDLIEDAKLEIEPWQSMFSPGHVKYYFRGLRPENFTLLRQTPLGPHAKLYRVFILHEGPLSAQLENEIELSPSSSTTARAIGSIRFKSGIGSIPETPDDVRKVVPFLKNSSKNISVRGSWDIGYIFFEDVLDFLDADGTVVGLEYGDKTFEFPQIKRLERGLVTVHLGYSERFFRIFGKEVATKFYGGMFLGSYKYAITLQNSGLTSPIALPVKTVGIDALETQFSSTLPDAQYLISFYEGSKLIQKLPIVIARDTTLRAIGQMWVEDSENQLTHVQPGSDPVVVLRGLQLLANPFPIIVESTGRPFDKTKKMPDLALKMNGKVTVLKAKAKEDPTYADRSLRLYFGAYRIPMDLQPGRYEATMVLDNNKHSLPYWSLIEIR